jgi:hypothetical protein
MKTLNLSGFMGASRREPHRPGWLTRFIGLLVGRAVPIDGYYVPKSKPKQVRTPRPEPVRWGNFR